MADATARNRSQQREPSTHRLSGTFHDFRTSNRKTENPCRRNLSGLQRPDGKPKIQAQQYRRRNARTSVDPGNRRSRNLHRGYLVPSHGKLHHARLDDSTVFSPVGSADFPDRSPRQSLSRKDQRFPRTTRARVSANHVTTKVTLSYFARNVIQSAFLRNPTWFAIGRERILFIAAMNLTKGTGSIMTVKPDGTGMQTI